MHIKQTRRCVACRKENQQSEMLRIAKINNEYLLDKCNNLHGRGAYVCKSQECINLTIKKKLFNRSFKANIGDEIYKMLGEYEQNN